MQSSNNSKQLTLDVNREPFTPKNISEKFELDGNIK
jgi:hypothetical protein